MPRHQEKFNINFNSDLKMTIGQLLRLVFCCLQIIPTSIYSNTKYASDSSTLFKHFGQIVRLEVINDIEKIRKSENGMTVWKRAEAASATDQFESTGPNLK